MMLLRPTSVLLTAERLHCDWVLVVPDSEGEGACNQGDDRSELPYWLSPTELQQAVEPKTGQPLRSLPVEEFPGELWTAAPVMMHAHLESWDAPSSVWQRPNFSSWVRQLLQWRQQPGRMTTSESMASSWRELQASGCGAVLASTSEAVEADVGSSNGRTSISGGKLFPATPSPRCQQAYEWFAPEPQAFAQWSPPAEGNVVALHSPFGVSEKLAAAAFEWQQQTPARAISLHLGEHRDERLYLSQQQGPLADLMQARGRGLKSKRWHSPVQWLEDVAPGPRPGTLAVHCADLDAAELRQLAAKQVEVVWCPGTHQYFSRAQPAFAAADLPAPMLGCDSRASNSQLNPLRELRLARRILPSYRAQDWWHAVTERAGKFWSQFIAAKPTTVGTSAMPLRFRDPALSSAAEVCDYLTVEPDLAPLSVPGIPPSNS